MNHIKRADDAVTFSQYVTGFAAAFLVILSLGYLAIVGDDIQQHRIEQAEAREAIRNHIERREHHPAYVWERICEDGLNWIQGECK